MPAHRWVHAGALRARQSHATPLQGSITGIFGATLVVQPLPVRLHPGDGLDALLLRACMSECGTTTVRAQDSDAPVFFDVV